MTSDIERIERFRRHGYGGAVSDALDELGIHDTVLSQRFRPLRVDMVLAGRALPVKLHSLVGADDLPPADDPYWVDEGGHPQQRMMEAVAASEDGVVLCFDCGGDEQAAQFGELSCMLAYTHGARGMLLAGNSRDTRHVVAMPDFPLFAFGQVPNAFGGWLISKVGEPVFLPGHLTHYVPVRSGDFVFGDGDGVQIIPEAVVDEVLVRVEARFQLENEQRRRLANGMPVDEVYRLFGVL